MRNVRLISTFVAFLLVLATAAAGRGLSGHGYYSGKTSQGTPVTFRLSPDGRRVARLEIHYRVTCSDGVARPTTFTDVLNIAIGRGRFAAHGFYVGSRDGSRNTYRVAGAITRRTAEGGFKLAATGTLRGRTVHCSSGPVLWAARFVR